ncbi:MAG: glycosyltransferase family 2 protein [Frankiaceae bacterium]|nr:glycosyltransferase family 2 protein [Frankiaceae bacterium]MBV9871471.1 glycosyltransferase family 2 protein [Frankiaceae bacterium]
MTSAGALVDVVVVTWNTREVTLMSLTNLMRAGADRGIRLLIHDNGSNDGTPDAIAAAFPGVELERGTTNLGFAGGVNAALQRSTAPWVLLLNSDAWPEPGAIDTLVDVAERLPRAAVVTPRLERPTGELEQSTWPLPSVRTAASSALRAGRYVWDHDEERPVGWAVGAAWLLRREAIDAIGLLDDSLFMYAEDLDWCWRAREAGWQVWFTPRAVVRHVGNASGEQRFGEARADAWINNSVRVFRRHRSRPLSLAWQAANAAGALLSSRRARRQGDPALAANWRRQARQWLQRPADDPAGSPA